MKARLRSAGLQLLELHGMLAIVNKARMCLCVAFVSALPFV
jgi:hypothetical protein